MGLKTEYDSQDAIEEPFRGLFTEDNGKFRLTGIEGLKTQADIDRIQGALTKERNDHKAIKSKYEILGDRDPTELLATLDRIEELEAAAGGKLDEEKINEIADKRLRTKVAPIERERDQLKQQMAALQAENDSFKEKERTRSIHDSVREAMTKSKVIDTAHEDVLMLAERMFEIDDAGKVVTKDGVGVTPGVSADVWLTDMQAKRPHWWPPSQGGGAGGSGGGSGAGADNPWSADGWNMTKQGQIYRENPTRAEQLAKAAGTKIGGLRPVKK